MKALKWISVFFIIFLGACSNPATDSTPPGEQTAGQQTAGQQTAGQQTAGQNATPAEAKSPLDITDLTVIPDVVQPFEKALIVVSVNNTSTEYGVFNVDIKVDERPFGTQVVALPGGAAQNITFDIIPRDEHNLWIRAGDLITELTVHVS